MQAPREVGRPAPRAGRASLWRGEQAQLPCMGERGALPSFLPSLLEVMARMLPVTGTPSCLLLLPLLAVTHPLVRVTTLMILN